MKRWMMLMLRNTENDQGSGAGAPATTETPAPAAAPPAINMDDLLGRMAQMMDQKIIGALQQVAPQQRAEPTDDPGEQVDETTKQYVQKAMGATSATMLQLANTQDALAFTQRFGTVFSTDEMNKIEQAHGAWLKAGVTFTVGGRVTPPSREDVANNLYGAINVQDRIKKGPGQQRANANVDATVETGGRGASFSQGGNVPANDFPREYTKWTSAQKADFHRKQLEEGQGGL